MSAARDPRRSRESLDSFAKKLARQRERMLRRWLAEVNDGTAFPQNIQKIEIKFQFDDGVTAYMKLEPQVTKRKKRGAIHAD